MTLAYCKGKVKVYLADGRQSPRLDPADVEAWIARYARRDG
jgi:hypothetical protein